MCSLLWLMALNRPTLCGFVSILALCSASSHSTNVVRKEKIHIAAGGHMIAHRQLSADVPAPVQHKVLASSTSPDNIVGSTLHSEAINGTQGNIGSQSYGSIQDLPKWRTCSAGATLVVVLVMILYWRKGPFVVFKVIIYLLALATMKGAVKYVEGCSFKFPLFLTGMHFVSGTLVGLAILSYQSIALGQQLVRPSLKDFKNRFGPIAPATALSVSMNNMALVHSTTAFVEIVGASSPIVTVLLTIAMNKPFDLKLLGPCFLVFIGCTLTSNGEAHFSMIGLLLSAGSNLPRAMKTILQQLLLQKDCEETAYSPLEVLFWTCLPSSVIMLTWSIIEEGVAPYQQLFQQGPMSLLMGALLLSCVNACILNTAVLFVVKDLGAVGTQMVAQTKSLLVVLGGMVILGEQVSRIEFVGFSLVMTGVYTYNKLEAKSKAESQEEAPSIDEKVPYVPSLK